MTKVRRPYSRVYWEALDDPKFTDSGVWDDDASLATWLRLLIAADMAWPASAALYHGVRGRALARLVEAGLVDLQSAGRYRIHGLDRERDARSRQASDAASARWDDDEPPHPGSIATSDAHGMRPHPVSNPARMPSQDEQRRRREETSQAEASRGRARDSDDVWTVAALIEELTGYTPSPKVAEDLRADVARLGGERVMTAIRAHHSAGPGPFDAATLAYGAHKALFPMHDATRNGSTPKPKGYQPDPEEVRRAFDSH